mmetsp:Transcript_27794/g.67632  ORF Transcript_27794/g.67632 Transcript_27794/m.67632 type:complete len:296 (-) Transcript_27794:122-1009(-)
MKFLISNVLVALCVIIPSASAFTPQPLALQKTCNAISETSLFSDAWWDQGASVYSKPSGAQPQFGAIQRAPGAPERMVPPQAWRNFSPQGKRRVEGQSRYTYDFRDTSQTDVQLALTSSTGRPVKSQCELWVGPDWTPYTMKAYSEDGEKRPIQCILGTRGKVAQIEVRNIAPYEFALDAEAVYAQGPLANLRSEIPQATQGIYIEGGSVKQVPVAGDVGAVSVLLNTDSRQLNAQIELLTGPNNPKQVFEVFTNNGLLNAILVVFECPPGHGTTIRITNQATMEFPCHAYVTAG